MKRKSVAEREYRPLEVIIWFLSHSVNPFFTREVPLDTEGK